jgi:O-methyltransferase involved in polyketide biosynthesis
MEMSTGMPSSKMMSIVADWHADRAMRAYIAASYEKNTRKVDEMLRFYRRHIRIADVLRRYAWMQDHKRVQKAHKKHFPKQLKSFGDLKMAA